MSGENTQREERRVSLDEPTRLGSSSCRERAVSAQRSEWKTGTDKVSDVPVAVTSMDLTALRGHHGREWMNNTHRSNGKHEESRVEYSRVQH